MIIYYTHNFTGGRDTSHELLKMAIGDLLGDHEEAAYLTAHMTTSGDNGKPVIKGFRHFSISHSCNTWAVLFADGECGLDVQYYRPCRMYQIAQRLFDPEDLDAFLMEPDEDSFFCIWARRESLIKAVGGSITAEDVPSVAECKAFYSGRNWYIRDIQIPSADKYAAAVCTGRRIKDKKIEFRELKTDRNNAIK